MEGALLALALLVCPIGMGFMMWFMSRGAPGGMRRAACERPTSLEELRSERDRLSADIERLERARHGRDGESGAL